MFLVMLWKLCVYNVVTLIVCFFFFIFFFFKQKTAYEMRISDWSSDVCSSDLRVAQHAHRLFGPRNLGLAARGVQIDLAELLVDRARRQPLRLELRGIENDANLAADPAVAIDARPAGAGEQLLGDVVVDVPAPLLHRPVGRDPIGSAPFRASVGQDM